MAKKLIWCFTERIRRNKDEVKLLPPWCRPLKHSMIWDLRWPGDFATRIESIRIKTLFCVVVTFERFARIASNLRFAIIANACPPKRNSQKNGSVQEPCAIRANLRIDLRELGHLSLRCPLRDLMCHFTHGFVMKGRSR